VDILNKCYTEKRLKIRKFFCFEITKMEAKDHFTKAFQLILNEPKDKAIH